jgi:hypothetical protein
MIFVAPTICLYSGLGLAVLIARIRRAPARRWALRASVIGLVAAGVMMLVVKLAYPYKSIYDVNSRTFARWFWTEKSRDANLVCVKADLGIGFDRRNWTLFRSALYLCNQKIYSPRHRSATRVASDSFFADDPVRCVLYNEWPENSPGCSAWLARMTKRYHVRNRETFVINESTHRDDGTDVEDRYTVFEFVPREVNPPRQIARDTSADVSRY